MRIEIKRLPLGDYTRDGAFYPKVDGKKVGEKDRCFWPSEQEARAAAERWVAMAATGAVT